VGTSRAPGTAEAGIRRLGVGRHGPRPRRRGPEPPDAPGIDRNGPLSARNGRPTRLSGHAAYIQPGGDGKDTCLAQVVHRTYASPDSGPTAEIVFLVVSGKRSQARLCDQSRSLASAASARLPAA
jgi:hypothetical protein